MFEIGPRKGAQMVETWNKADAKDFVMGPFNIMGLKRVPKSLYEKNALALVGFEALHVVRALQNTVSWCEQF